MRLFAVIVLALASAVAFCLCYKSLKKQDWAEPEELARVVFWLIASAVCAAAALLYASGHVPGF